MPQSLASLPVHFVFSTKNRAPWLDADISERLYPYIGGTARALGWKLLAAGGMPDHIHLLISVSRDASASEVMRAVKSNSSRWIHETFPSAAGFSWQAGYGAFAVSVSLIDTVRAYIARQEDHHASQTFQDEYRELLRRHDVEWDERYVWD